jgi:uncharacterized protein YgiM (DUF1202 family)
MKYLFSLLAILSLSCASTALPAAPPELPTGARMISLPAVMSAPVPPVSMVVCHSGGLNLRTGAGMNYPAVDVLADGTIVEIIRDPEVEKIGWRHIKGGYVNAGYLCRK